LNSVSIVVVTVVDFHVIIIIIIVIIITSKGVKRILFLFVAIMVVFLCQRHGRHNTRHQCSLIH
jgi:hypothetical protein